MIEWGKTNGELMVEAMVRDARRRLWLSRLANIFLVVGILAIFKYLFT